MEERDTRPPLSALFDVRDDWNAPRYPWHDHYPDDSPPGCHRPSIRVEEFLRSSAKSYPDRPAVHFFNTTWTFKELRRRVEQVAGHFRAMGIKPGDRALFVLPNCPEFIVAWFALHYCGAEIIHGSPLYPGSEVANLIRRTQPKIMIGVDVKLDPCTDALKEVSVPNLIVTSVAPHLPLHLRGLYFLKTVSMGRPVVPAETKQIAFTSLYAKSASPMTEPIDSDPSKVAVLQPTGGTTGSPKLAMLTHANLVSVICQSHTVVRREPATDTCISVLPFFHVYGSSVIMLASVAGAATQVLMPRFDVKMMAKAIEKYQPTALPLVPFMFQALNEELTRKPRKVAPIEIVTSGSAPLDDEVRARFEELTGSVVTEGYGLSEASPVLTANIKETNRHGTVGFPIPSTEVKLVDPFEGKREMGVGEVGELIARGPQIMKGYLDNPTETTETIRDGWLYTGDLATMDADGYFRIVDRKKDMIISGGLNIFPSEVEAKIKELDGVADCAVVGQKDPRWGEKVVAYVVPQAGAVLDCRHLKEGCRPKMAQYKIPREFHIVESLPLSFLGKVRRSELRSVAPAPPSTSQAAAG